jgi:hypothetical protein
LEGGESQGELQEFLAQNQGAYGFPPRWVGVEGLKEIV